MQTVLLAATLVLLAVAVALLVVLVVRRPAAPDLSQLATRADTERAERTAREEANAARAAAAEQARQLREEMSTSLRSTLDSRLGESLTMVARSLEEVQRNIGQMQALAGDVGDLKRVMSNVKARGTWGEVQLGALLELVLSPDHYEANVMLGDGREVVEFAVKLPGQGSDGPVWLPIDSKFPLEDYMRLTDAQERGDAEAAVAARVELDRAVRASARAIHDKYIRPPRTTDFAVLFLPTESLYAEVLRKPGFVESLQQELQVTLAGPTTLCAFLNSLRMGFRSLAIQQKSSEVWQTLAAVKAEFDRFEDSLGTLRKRLDSAVKGVEAMGTRTRVMKKKLRDVEAAPVSDGSVPRVIALPDELLPSPERPTPVS